MKVRMPATLAAAMLTMLAAVSLTACSGAASVSGSTASTTIPLLRVGLPFPISSLDETKVNPAGWIAGLCLETLLKFSPQGRLEPVLATSWAQTSPVTYVYHLRRGVRFWDGHPLTAADVVYSLDYDRAPGSRLAFAFADVKTITATDAETVTVTLTHPDASWQYVPAQTNSYIFEQQFQQAHKSDFGLPGTLLMGTGPWQPVSLDPTKGGQVSANPHWWGGKAPIQRVSFTFFSSETSEALAFRAGEIDFAPNISSPKSFAAISGAKLQTTATCDTGFFQMNVTQPGWDDIHVRRAVAYALNRADIIAANGGYAEPMYTLTPPSLLRSIASQSQINALLKSIPLYQYNPTKARQEMAQSAYPHGFTAELPTTNDATSLNIAQVVAAELGKIGIRLQIKPMNIDAWLTLETGPASKRLASVSGGGCFNADPGTFSDFLGSSNTQIGSYNEADYTPAAVDALLREGVATSNPAQRFAVYSQLWARLQTDEPYVGLYVSQAAIALSPKFTYPDYSQWIWNLPYTLGIKPA